MGVQVGMTMTLMGDRVGHGGHGAEEDGALEMHCCGGFGCVGE